MAKNYEDVKTGTHNYFVKYDNGFSNAYGLCYAPAGTSTPEGWERITRKEAIKLCTEERERRRDNASFGRYASDQILPLDVVMLPHGAYIDVDYTYHGYIVPHDRIDIYRL